MRRRVREVRREPEIAVALVPARQCVAGNGVHLHLEREEVVTALDAVLGCFLDEELAVETLAHQAPLHVREGDDDRVDRAALDLRPQFLERDHEPESSPAIRSRSNRWAISSAADSRSAGSVVVTAAQ